MTEGDVLERMAIAAFRTMPPMRGKTAISWRLMERARRAGRLTGSWRLTLRDGSLLELPRSSTMTWAAAADGFYDTHVINALTQYVEPGSIVLDVGASLGLWTVQLARAARLREAVVHGFEPNAANIPWLYRNIELNNLQDTVTIHDIGLGDTDTHVAFGGIEPGGVGNGHLLSPDAGDAAERTVALRRLDSLTFTRRVSLIKLDVEGYEPAVLRGATDLLKRDRPVIFGEFSPQSLAERGENLESTIDLIGYQPFRLTDHRSQFWRPRDETAVEPLSRPLSPEPDLMLIPPALG